MEEASKTRPTFRIWQGGGLAIWGGTVDLSGCNIYSNTAEYSNSNGVSGKRLTIYALGSSKPPSALHDGVLFSLVAEWRRCVYLRGEHDGQLAGLPHFFQHC